MTFKILTVDDSKMVRTIVAKTFRPYACEISEASNGAEGLAMAESLRPDLIFLDITMADMNGVEVLEKLRQTENLRDTPVIMLTAESGSGTMEKVDQLRISAYVSKPFKSEQLLAEAGKVLNLQAAA